MSGPKFLLARDEIARRYRSGQRTMEIAVEFGCSKPTVYRYARQLGVAPVRPARIADRLDDFIEPEPNSGCHLWTGRVGRGGYGSITVGSKHRLVHRLRYEREFGPIPEGMFACHRCDTPACVNPDHLFLGTVVDNNRDAVRKGRSRHVLTEANAAKVRCHKGHELSGENLHVFVTRRGRRFRVCRACQRETVRRYRMRRRILEVAS